MKCEKIASENNHAIFDIKKGTRFKLNIVGVKSFSESVIKKMILSVDEYHNDFESVEKKLKTLYHAAGFPLVTVQMDEIERVVKKRKLNTIQVTIDEKKRIFLKDILIKGAGKEEEALKDSIISFVNSSLEEKELPIITMTRSSLGGGYREKDGEKVKAIKRSKENRVLIAGAEYAIPESFLPEIKEYIRLYMEKKGFRYAKVTDIGFLFNEGKQYLSIEIKRVRNLCYPGLNWRTQILNSETKYMTIYHSTETFHLPKKLKNYTRKKLKLFCIPKGIFLQM